MYARFPRGRYAERAAWKAGWTSYRARRHERRGPVLRVGVGEFSTVGLPPRVAVLVGPGACAMGDTPGAVARYQLTIADYHNTYYGRLAERTLQKQGVALAPSRLVFAPSDVPLGGEDE